MRFGRAGFKKSFTTMRDLRPAGFGLRLYLIAMSMLRPFAQLLLKRRIARGKEHPERWREKMGIATVDRPSGRLVWLHAVGLGEVMALRGIIATLATIDPDLSFLVTSSTRQSAEVFSKNLPPRTVHQFLPLDVPAYAQRFLSHWSPNLAIWSEQDLWPGLVFYADEYSIPQALINARMNEKSFLERSAARAVYADMFQRFFRISAQDKSTATYITTLGAEGDIRVDGSIKPLAQPITTDLADHLILNAAIADRLCWVVCPSHPDDEAIALTAHRNVTAAHPNALLIIIPRFVERGMAICDDARKQGFDVAQRSNGDAITTKTQVYVADTLGEAGFWYSLCHCAVIGGGFDDTQGHNPWEAARLGCPILHGPNTANFQRDYCVLDDNGGAVCIQNAQQLADAILQLDRNEMIAAQTDAVDQMTKPFDKLARDLIAAIE